MTIRHIGRLFSIGFIAAGLTACADTTDSGHEEQVIQARSQAISGGYEDEESTFAVGLYAAQGYAGGICSGTLIAPNLVLTAQHCVAQVTSQYVICGESGFGSKLNPRNILATTAPRLSRRAYFHQGLEVHTPPGGNDMCGFDIALIILDENVPPDVATPAIPRIDIEPEPGEVYSAIGYGHVGNGYGSGTRRRIDNRSVTCSAGSCPAYSSVQTTEFLGTEGTCQGDSGGTALDAQGRVIGALSRGPDGCRASVYSAVSGWSGWMREIGEMAAEKGRYDAPFWVTHGVSEIPADDLDLDGVLVGTDNCPDVENADQADLDGDGEGDACETDVDGDETNDDDDNCVLDANADQADADGDGQGDACDTDDDDDGVDDADDNCPLIDNGDQADSDGDGVGDACQPQIDFGGGENGQSGGCSATNADASSSATMFGLFLLGLIGIRRRK